MNAGDIQIQQEPDDLLRVYVIACCDRSAASAANAQSLAVSQSLHYACKAACRAGVRVMKLARMSVDRKQDVIDTGFNDCLCESEVGQSQAIRNERYVDKAQRPCVIRQLN
jgi:hypothetical protein